MKEIGRLYNIERLYYILIKQLRFYGQFTGCSRKNKAVVVQFNLITNYSIYLFYLFEYVLVSCKVAKIHFTMQHGYKYGLVDVLYKVIILI